MQRVWFTEVNPDKGTETGISLNSTSHIFAKFTEVNPDKGTETNQKVSEKYNNREVYRS